MARIADIIKYEGDNSTFIWKHPCEDFNALTQPIVHESQEAVFLVEYSMGSTCYLRCYTVYMFDTGNSYDSIGFQSLFLDDIFGFLTVLFPDIINQGLDIGIHSHGINVILLILRKRRVHDLPCSVCSILHIQL